MLKTARMRLLSSTTSVGLVTAACLSIFTANATADGPGVGTPYVATIGDSYISGEAGRWGGNTNSSYGNVDALGSTAYSDTSGGPVIAGCDRSLSAEAHIGGGVGSVNFACSGAKTNTVDGNSFKPGIDFYDNGSGRIGQARMLQNYAANHNVKMVVLSIGGNNFNFASIVATCVADFLYSPSWYPDYCNDDSSVTSNFTSANVSAQTTAIRNAILNVRTAMQNAGYSSSQWTLVVQNYPSPIPNSSGFRYSQSGYTRQSTGGCGFWNNDANWANSTALPTINNAVSNAVAQSGLTNVKTLDLRSAFNGRRLCENTVGLLEEVGLSHWTNSGAVNKTEWIAQIRTVSTANSPYMIQESLHPNYWGQLALRNCVRQIYNAGLPRSGACSIYSTGLTSRGEPNMILR